MKTASTWSQPLRVHLAVVMVGLLVGVSGLIAGLHYVSGRRAAIELAGDSMRILSDRLVEKYRLLSVESLMFVEGAAIADEFRAPPPADLASKIAHLRLAIDRSAQIDSAYVAYPGGEFVQVVQLSRSSAWQSALGAPAQATYGVRVITAGADGRRLSQWLFYDAAMKELGATERAGTNYDPRKRPWYLRAAHQAATVSVPPYVMATTNELGMTISRAHASDGGIVFGVDVILSTLSRFLDSSRMARNALTLVVAADGQAVLRSGPADIDVAPLVAQARAGGERQYLFSAQVAGQRYLASSIAVDFDGLLKGSHIVVAAPLSELTAAAHRALRRDLVVAAVILLLGALLALVLARWIAGALRQLTSEADNLKDLHLAPPVHVLSRISEVSALGRAMVAARTAINGFGLYVPIAIVRSMLDDGRFTRRSAARQEVTALFTDIADFTTISEHTSPEDVVSMLSAYFDRIHTVVLANNGALIQFLGDSVFALWNAPVADDDHAEHACRCALDMMREIEAFNREQEAKGAPVFRTRVGIHTGLAVVGSVGAESRLQYTSMGDTINLASRLEGINKAYGTSILVSESTASRCRDAFEFRRIDTVQAKGRSEAVTVYELVAARDEPESRQSAGPG